MLCAAGSQTLPLKELIGKRKQPIYKTPDRCPWASILHVVTRCCRIKAEDVYAGYLVWTVQREV